MRFLQSRVDPPNGLGGSTPAPGPASQQPTSTAAWDPLREPTFRALWTAALVSNIGTWMQNVGGVWLMTQLSPSPLLVALMQTATSLPVLLIGLPAGALADVMDRRRLLLLTQTWMMLCAATLGILTLAGATGPWLLLGLTFALGMGTAVNNPAWGAAAPEVVSRQRLPAAIALNGVSINLARAVGPALGGVLVAVMGPGLNFLLNAASYLGTILALLGWRRTARPATLPAERLLGATRAGIRYTRFAPALRAVLVRTGLFIAGASALWALLPVFARSELGLDAGGYGVLLGMVGVGAVAGAMALPRLREHLSPDAILTRATLTFAIALVVLALTRSFSVACVMLLAAGTTWMLALTGFNVSAQTNVPGWVRARALSTYFLVFQGGLALGSAGWGIVAEQFGTPITFGIAAGTLLVGMLGARGQKLLESPPNLKPSRYWADLDLAVEPDPEAGPVLITVEYRVQPARADDFVRAMRVLGETRRRDGAYRWNLYRDPEQPNRFLETFLVETWIEHMRQHARTTEADRAVSVEAYAYTEAGGPEHVSHFVSVTKVQWPDPVSASEPDSDAETDMDARPGANASS